MLQLADQEPEKRFILPFATPTATRRRDFTKNMEMAAILYLAESKREKGEHHVFKKSDEKLVFLSEVRYPLWLIPYHGATLIFDGLGLTSHTLSYDAIPDTEVFNKTLRDNRKTTDAYAATLARHKNYFGNIVGKEEITIASLITRSDLVDDFKNYLPRMTKAPNQFTTQAVLTAVNEAREIRAGLDQLSTLRQRTGQDIDNIGASMKLLSRTTGRRIQALRREIRATREKYGEQIEKIKPKVRRKVGEIHRKYTRIIAGKSARAKKQLRGLHENQIKLRKTLRHLNTEAKRCETGRRSGRRGKKTQWTLKLQRIKKKLPGVRKKLKATTKKVRDVEAKLKLEVAQQKTECDERIEAGNKIFLDLQASRDADITMKRREIATLEDLTRHITTSMQALVQRKRAFLKEFDTITLRGGKRLRGLVYVPFYLARYERDDKTRYVVFPPSLVSDMGILTKMKGALGAAKLTALLQPRSKAMAAFMNRLVALIETHPMLQKDLTEAGIQGSILLKKRLRLGVKEGLVKLENEHWISPKEFEAFSKLLYVYTSAVRH